MFIMKKFSVQKTNDPWRAPEMCPNVLCGEVYGRPWFPDGSKVMTSVIKEVNGRVVTTSSGTQYKLVGPALKLFRDFLKEKGLSYDSKNPLDSCKKYWQDGGFTNK